MMTYIENLINSPVGLIGVCASVLVLVSMCFNTRTRKGELIMRSLNCVGSVVSVIYGILLGPDGFGMILLNGSLIFVNSYYLLKSIRNKSREE